MEYDYISVVFLPGNDNYLLFESTCVTGVSVVTLVGRTCSIRLDCF